VVAAAVAAAQAVMVALEEELLVALVQQFQVRLLREEINLQEGLLLIQI
jgi:hypothetical protein